MKKNKGLFGGLLEFGGNMIGKVMDVTLSITDKISRNLFGDKITDAVETPLKAVENAGKITAGRIGELPEKLEQEAAKYEKISGMGNKDIASKGFNDLLTNDIGNSKTGIHYLPDNPASNIAKGKANASLTNDIGNLINGKTAGSSALAGPAGNLAQDIDLNK